MTKNVQKTEKHTEIKRLAEMLNNAQIPFFMRDVIDGYQILYGDDDDFICSAVEYGHTYGADEDLIEIMGLLTPEELEEDEVVGYLTAEDVFNRISNHWKATH